MARLTRVHQKVFASNASNNGVFGSLQAGNPQTSNDVATLQSLSAFENGWDDAIEQGDKLPPLEEFQGIQYGISYQQAYMLQEGIAEWDASTPYYKGSLTKTISGTSFKLYCSLQDNNTNHVVTNTTYWKLVMDSDDTYAFDNTVVHKTGTESISGNKTFSGSVSLNGTISASQSARQTIIGWGMPDYDSGVAITSPYTPTVDGIIVTQKNSGYSTAEIKLTDGNIIARHQSADSGSSNNIIWAFAKSGKSYTMNGTSTFYPFIGV